MALRFHFTPGGSGTPAAAYGNVYIVADGVLYALDAKLGKMNWYSSQDDFQNVSVANGVVYASGRSETLYAFDSNLGGLLASWNTGYDYLGGPAISDGTVRMNDDGPNAIASSLPAGTGAVRSEPHVAEISTVNPDLTLELIRR
jgi:outer membrane protein assembly factor BamB